MIYAVPIDQENSSAAVSLKFARSPYFAIIYSNEKKYIIIENPFKDQKMEVGKNVLSLLINEYGVKTVVGFELGLNVFELTKKKQTQVIIISKINQSFHQILKWLQIET